MIRLLTLKNGLSILCDAEELDSTTGKFYKIKNPVIVQSVAPGDTNRGKVAFIPFLEFAKEFNTGICLSYGEVLFDNTPVDELTSKYQEIFSRIIIPDTLFGPR